jgi:L-lactate dehydrogenase complex protein LldF
MEGFWRSLKCIRCGACMNTCPVYRRSGGLSYGATYSGPIGVIIDPTFNLRKYSALPFASTLNGPMVKKEAMRMAGKVLSSPKLYRLAVKAAQAGLDYLPRSMIYNPLNAWGKQRDVPKAPEQSFREWYLENR